MYLKLDNSLHCFLFLSKGFSSVNVEKRKGLFLQTGSTLSLLGNGAVTRQVLLNIEPKPVLPKEQKLLIIAQPLEIVL